MVEFLQRVRNHRTSADTEIEIANMQFEDAAFWDHYVRPFIRNVTPRRADYSWHWMGIYAILPSAQAMANRRCRALTIHLQSAGFRIPAAMLFLIESYPWCDPSPWRRLAFWRKFERSTFTWFLASAPNEALATFGIDQPPSLGRALIDSAIVLSFNSGHAGRMWLHASPWGGVDLDRFYRRVGLSAIKPGTRVPHLIRPLSGIRSDGRHFYADSTIAKLVTEALNKDRQSV